MLARYLTEWDLVADGPVLETNSSRLQPVLLGQEPAWLKVSKVDEERRGGALMAWWDGVGAARVLAYDSNALLLERAVDERSLKRMALSGSDQEATTIQCEVAGQLHRRADSTTPVLDPLETWFEALFEGQKSSAKLQSSSPGPGAYSDASALESADELISLARTTAANLLANQRELVVLHGDLHHENVLDFGARGWLAIDPKALYGERTFDFANILRNPTPELALDPARFEQQIELIVDCAKIERRRLLEWTLALGGLSACWLLEDGVEPTLDLGVARLAANALDAG